MNSIESRTLDSQENPLSSEKLSGKPETLIENEQQLEVLVQDYGTDLNATAETIYRSAHERLESVVTSVHAPADTVENVQEKLGTQAKLKELFDKAKALAQEGIESMVKVAAAGLAAVSIGNAEVGDSVSKVVTGIPNGGGIASASLERKQTSDQTKEVLNIKQNLIRHIQSPEYLEKLTKEMNGDSTKAKELQAGRAADVEAVKVFGFEKSAVQKLGKFGTALDIWGFYSPGEHHAVIATTYAEHPGVSPRPVPFEGSLTHELSHASTRGNAGITDKAKAILTESAKEGTSKYLKDPTERLARKQKLDLQLEQLGIKKYGERFTDEHYEMMEKWNTRGAFAYDVKDLIKSTKPEEFKRMMNEIALNDQSTDTTVS